MRINKPVIILAALFVVSCLFGFYTTVSHAEESQAEMLHEQLLKKLESLTPSDTIEVNMGTEKEEYFLGDPFEIRFQASKESYIMLMDISPDGSITFLAPSIQLPDNKFEAERIYSTLADLDLRIKIAEPVGYETINLFCSTEKIDLFDVDFEKEQFYIIKKTDETRLKDLIARLDQLEKVEWSGNSVKINIKAKGTRGTTVGPPQIFGALPPIGATGSTGKFFPPLPATGTTGKN